MKIRMLICGIFAGLVSMLDSSCSGFGGEDTFPLIVRNSDSERIEVSVSAEDWPSRYIAFSRRNEKSMEAFAEPIFESIVEIKVKNLSPHPVKLRVNGDVTTLESGDVFSLEKVSFPKFNFIAIPVDGKDAKVELHLKFDQKYTTSGDWVISASWSDGP